MAEPMSDERLAEIREPVPHGSNCVWTLVRQKAELLYEVDRLRTELAAAVEDTARLGLEVHELTQERDHARAERDKLRHELDEERERTTKAFVAQRRAERERDQTAERIEQAREDAVGHVERTTDAETERDRLAEQVKRDRDPDLIRKAIADPGAYVERKKNACGEPAETVPAWGARAVIAALDGTEAGS